MWDFAENIGEGVTASPALLPPASYASVELHSIIKLL